MDQKPQHYKTGQREQVTVQRYTKLNEKLRPTIPVDVSLLSEAALLTRQMAVRSQLSAAEQGESKINQIIRENIITEITSDTPIVQFSEVNSILNKITIVAESEIMDYDDAEMDRAQSPLKRAILQQNRPETQQLSILQGEGANLSDFELMCMAFQNTVDGLQDPNAKLTLCKILKYFQQKLGAEPQRVQEYLKTMQIMDSKLIAINQQNETLLKQVAGLEQDAFLKKQHITTQENKIVKLQAIIYQHDVYKENAEIQENKLQQQLKTLNNNFQNAEVSLQNALYRGRKSGTHIVHLKAQYEDLLRRGTKVQEELVRVRKHSESLQNKINMLESDLRLANKTMDDVECEHQQQLSVLKRALYDKDVEFKNYREHNETFRKENVLSTDQVEKCSKFLYQLTGLDDESFRKLGIPIDGLDQLQKFLYIGQQSNSLKNFLVNVKVSGIGINTKSVQTSIADVDVKMKENIDQILQMEVEKLRQQYSKKYDQFVLLSFQPDEDRLANTYKAALQCENDVRFGIVFNDRAHLKTFCDQLIEEQNRTICKSDKKQTVKIEQQRQTKPFVGQISDIIDYESKNSENFTLNLNLNCSIKNKLIMQQQEQKVLLDLQIAEQRKQKQIQYQEENGKLLIDQLNLSHNSSHHSDTKKISVASDLAAMKKTIKAQLVDQQSLSKASHIQQAYAEDSISSEESSTSTETTSESTSRQPRAKKGNEFNPTVWTTIVPTFENHETQTIYVGNAIGLQTDRIQVDYYQSELLDQTKIYLKQVENDVYPADAHFSQHKIQDQVNAFDKIPILNQPQGNMDKLASSILPAEQEHQMNQIPTYLSVNQGITVQQQSFYEKQIESLNQIISQLQYQIQTMNTTMKQTKLECQDSVSYQSTEYKETQTNQFGQPCQFDEIQADYLLKTYKNLDNACHSSKLQLQVISNQNSLENTQAIVQCRYTQTDYTSINDQEIIVQLKKQIQEIQGKLFSTQRSMSDISRKNQIGQPTVFPQTLVSQQVQDQKEYVCVDCPSLSIVDQPIEQKISEFQQQIFPVQPVQIDHYVRQIIMQDGSQQDGLNSGQKQNDNNIIKPSTSNQQIRHPDSPINITVTNLEISVEQQLKTEFNNFSMQTDNTSIVPQNLLITNQVDQTKYRENLVSIGVQSSQQMFLLDSGFQTDESSGFTIMNERRKLLEMDNQRYELVNNKLRESKNVGIPSVLTNMNKEIQQQVSQKVLERFQNQKTVDVSSTKSSIKIENLQTQDGEQELDELPLELMQKEAIINKLSLDIQNSIRTEMVQKQEVSKFFQKVEQLPNIRDLTVKTIKPSNIHVLTNSVCQSVEMVKQFRINRLQQQSEISIACVSKLASFPDRIWKCQNHFMSMLNSSTFQTSSVYSQYFQGQSFVIINMLKLIKNSKYCISFQTDDNENPVSFQAMPIAVPQNYDFKCQQVKNNLLYNSYMMELDNIANSIPAINQQNSRTPSFFNQILQLVRFNSISQNFKLKIPRFAEIIGEKTQLLLDIQICIEDINYYRIPQQLTVKMKTLNWLHKQIKMYYKKLYSQQRSHIIYVERIESKGDIVHNLQRSDSGLFLNDLVLAEFIFNDLQSRYYQPKLVAQQAYDLLVNVLLFMSTDQEVYLFSKFLFQDQHNFLVEDILLLFLQYRESLQIDNGSENYGNILVECNQIQPLLKAIYPTWDSDRVGQLVQIILDMVSGQQRMRACQLFPIILQSYMSFRNGSLRLVDRVLHRLSGENRIFIEEFKQLVYIFDLHLTELQMIELFLQAKFNKNKLFSISDKDFRSTYYSSEEILKIIIRNGLVRFLDLNIDLSVFAGTIQEKVNVRLLSTISIAVERVSVKVYQKFQQISQTLANNLDCFHTKLHQLQVLVDMQDSQLAQGLMKDLLLQLFGFIDEVDPRGFIWYVFFEKCVWVLNRWLNN